MAVSACGACLHVLGRASPIGSEDKKMEKFDCIVVGGGPAGATVARQTARRGLKTLLVDKASLPRYKPCGGALTPAIEHLLDIDFNDLVENVAHDITFLSKGEEGQVSWLDRIKIQLISRSSFDYRLVEEATRAGALVMDKTKIVSLEEADNHVNVRTDKDRIITGLVVVGADGAKSSVAKSIGLGGAPCGFSIEGELYPDDGETLRKYGGRLFFGFGFVPDGYGWVFPKRDHFSVGIGTMKGTVPGITSMYEEFKGCFDFLKGAEERIRRGWFIPCNRGYRTLNTQRVCLAGDAASLVDPFSGEGIYYSVWSGLIAADIISGELDTRGRLSDAYTRGINRQIVKDFVYARRFANVFFKAPDFFYRKEAVIRTLFRILGKDANYRYVFDELKKRGIKLALRSLLSHFHSRLSAE